jgi:hypothetical protein
MGWIGELYTGQINKTGRAHGFGVVTEQSGTLAGVFVNGAPSVAIYRAKNGYICMQSYDVKMLMHGPWLYVLTDGTREVDTYNHGVRVHSARGESVACANK